jgi:hypothetical protein
LRINADFLRGISTWRLMCPIHVVVLSEVHEFSLTVLKW